MSKEKNVFDKIGRIGLLPFVLSCYIVYCFLINLGSSVRAWLNEEKL